MGVADDFAPSFTQKPQLRQEDEGNRLVFECQLLASPKPDIDWYRGETHLVEDGRTFMRIQPVGTNKFLVVLELDDVIESDAGLYKVKAKNKMGEVAGSINLNFSREYPGTLLPHFLLHLNTLSARGLEMQHWKFLAIFAQSLNFYEFQSEYLL
jgi:Immunoglobulin I-set domain